MLRRSIGVIPQLGKRFASTLTSLSSIRSMNIPMNNYSSIITNFTHHSNNINVRVMELPMTSKVIDEIRQIGELNFENDGFKDDEEASKSMELTSVLRKRRLKMKKHKLKKRRKAQRALKIRIGK